MQAVAALTGLFADARFPGRGGPPVQGIVPPAPEPWEIPRRILVDFDFEIVIERPILGFTHNRALKGRFGGTPLL